MVAAVVGRGELPLGVDRPPELAAPEDERVFEEASVFEILDEGKGRAVDVPRLGGKHLGRELMDVPPAVIDLDEADAALDEPPCHERRVLERAGLFGFLAPPLEGAFGLAGKVRHLRHRRLHAEGHLVLRDPGQGLRASNLLVLDLIQLAEPIEHPPPELSGI